MDDDMKRLDATDGGGEFDESKHPRDSDGKFTDGKGRGEVRQDLPSKKGKTKTHNELFGVGYEGFKGDKAIDKLLLEKQGHIKAAFYRENMGDIDLLWGDDTVGIAHILKRREKQNIDGIKLVRKIPEIIEKGNFIHDEKRGRFNIEHNGDRVVIKPTYDGQKVTWLMTAMEIKKPLED